MQEYLRLTSNSINYSTTWFLTLNYPKQLLQ